METPSFEEDLMNNRVVMLNQNGVNRVVEIIKEKDKKIEKLNNIINKLEIILEKERKIVRPSDDYNYGVGNTLDYLWYKLQELKGGSNENNNKENNK